jgi:RNA polymerase sigma-54 factor
MLNQRLQQKLLQKLSPQQIQMIKLLEVPVMELEQRIKKELEENPLLEEGDTEETDIIDETDDTSDENESEQDNEDELPVKNEDDEFSLDDYIEDEDIPTYKLEANNYSKDEKKEDIPFSVGDTFIENLKNQLGWQTLTERQQFLAEYLIGNLDEDGYIRRKLDAIADDLAFSMNFKTNEFELLEVLRLIQTLDPAGVGARDLQECLLLQIERKNLNDPDVALAQSILNNYFDEFSRRHYEKIQDKLDLSDGQLRDAIGEIVKLNPKPGSTFNDPNNKSSEHIVPDFILENNDGDLQLTLNSKNLPELRISSSYNDMLSSLKGHKSNTKDQKEAVSFVKQKLDSAKWFIDALRQRENTLLMTMNAIIDYQRDYFQDGDDKLLRPMILKDIADKTGLDISTISRVANSKYIQTHFGIYPLKFFFSEGMQNDSGEEVSTREIKRILQDTLENEDKRNPVTDEQLAAILKEKGYPIARRTVAKYREQLGIPVARLRKEI